MSGTPAMSQSSASCGLKAHKHEAQGFQPCDRGQNRKCDLKGRKKFSHSDQLRSMTSRDPSGRTFCFASRSQGWKPCALCSRAFSPQGLTRFDKSTRQ